MALQRFKEVFLIALIVGCINIAGVNGAELNSTNFASSTTTKIPTTKDRSAQMDTRGSVPVALATEEEASLAPKLSLSETTETKGNLTEARITSITFRSEEADVDNNKENDETISFGIRSFTVEIATPATEKPIPLNEKVSAASKMNVQQAAASSLPILTLESDQDRNDKVSNERVKVFEALPPAIDALAPTSTTKNKHENVASTIATPNDAKTVKKPTNIRKSVDTSDFKPASTMAPLQLATKNGEQSSIDNQNEHEQLSISSNGMHVEQKLENGLYRIKIAEIITDEFSNGHTHDGNDAKQNLEDETVSNAKQNNNKHDNDMHRPASQRASGQVNIADLYPSKLEDFSSIIRESNEKMIEEKNRYVGLEKSNSDYNNRPIISDARFNIIDDANERKNSILFGNEGDATAMVGGDNQIQHAKINGAFNSIENNIPTTKIEIELIDEPNGGASKDGDVTSIVDDDDYVSPVKRTNNGPNNGDRVTDFTSELQLKDDMVSKIERSFRDISMTNMEEQQNQQQQIQLQQFRQQQEQNLQEQMNRVNQLTILGGMGFIERRVKKFDPTFRKRFTDTNRESLPSSANIKSIDENIISQSDEERKLDANISNAKFNSHYANDGIQRNETTVKQNKTVANKQTNNNTKSNSSKSQMDDKNNKVDDLIESSHVSLNTNGIGADTASSIHTAQKEVVLSTLKPINSTERKILFINVNSGSNNTIDKNELERLQKDRQQIIKESQLNANATNKMNGSNATMSTTNMHLYIIHNDAIGQKPFESIKTNYSNANKESPTISSTLSQTASLTTAAEATASASVAPPNSLLEAHPSESVVKLNQPTSKEPSAAPALIDAISSTESDKHSSSLNTIKSITQSRSSTTTTTTTTTTTPTTTVQTQSHSINHLAKQKPYSRRGFDSFYFETECDMQTPLPTDSNIWRGNETHELNLPTTTPENCAGGGDCMPMIISWEGAAEIQSGDVLIVEIDDTLLLPADMNPSTANNIDNGHRVATAVYQVTRPGHEHCDATEGILLDITPLIVDGKKLVTLYDKDLTEGVNLLIVVSELWGPQCVRLKVTVKSDNCGENAQCNGKGICFSNASMEGYECQCCSGFAGSHCEEIDACFPSPCTNNGICVDLSQGHDGNSYQCLCPYAIFDAIKLMETMERKGKSG
ncbi:myb-like protein I [Contarinia nasturtii]|uniref:myb-like protein I n=1 Tax=Contarinia nasturtii TaxID=265458 RepID=UPI0012D3905C|nr:myb-like protein I [Contarinia nasturtii]